MARTTVLSLKWLVSCCPEVAGGAATSMAHPVVPAHFPSHSSPIFCSGLTAPSSTLPATSGIVKAAEGAARRPAFQEMIDRVSEFTLPNGLHFICLERHEAPVLSCMVYANVGAFDEEEGSTGERNAVYPISHQLWD